MTEEADFEALRQALEFLRDKAANPNDEDLVLWDDVKAELWRRTGAALDALSRIEGKR